MAAAGEVIVCRGPGDACVRQWGNAYLADDAYSIAFNEVSGKVLTVAYDTLIPYVTFDQHADGVLLTGYLGDLWTILETTLGFRSSYVRVNGNGARGMLLRGTADVYLSATVITSDEDDLFDHTQPVVTHWWWRTPPTASYVRAMSPSMWCMTLVAYGWCCRYQLFARKGLPEVSADSYVRAMSPSMWCMTLVAYGWCCRYQLFARKGLPEVSAASYVRAMSPSMWCMTLVAYGWCCRYQLFARKGLPEVSAASYVRAMSPSMWCMTLVAYGWCCRYQLFARKGLPEVSADSYVRAMSPSMWCMTLVAYGWCCRYQLFARKGLPEVSADSYVRAMSPSMWCMTLVALVLLCAVLRALVWLRAALGLPPGVEPDTASLGSCALSVLGGLCSQGWQESPSCPSARVAVVTTLFFGYLMYNAYAAALISHLASGHYTAPFSSLDEVVRRATHTLCVRNESYAYFSLLKQGPKWRRVLNRGVCREASQARLTEALCDHTEAVVLEIPSVMAAALEARPGCQGEVLRVKNRVQRATASLLLRRGFPYLQAIDYMITRCRATGVLDRLEKQYLDGLAVQGAVATAGQDAGNAITGVQVAFRTNDWAPPDRMTGQWEVEARQDDRGGEKQKEKFLRKNLNPGSATSGTSLCRHGYDATVTFEHVRWVLASYACALAVPLLVLAAECLCKMRAPSTLLVAVVMASAAAVAARIAGHVRDDALGAPYSAATVAGLAGDFFASRGVAQLVLRVCASREGISAESSTPTPVLPYATADGARLTRILATDGRFRVGSEELAVVPPLQRQRPGPPVLGVLVWACAGERLDVDSRTLKAGHSWLLVDPASLAEYEPGLRLDSEVTVARPLLDSRDSRDDIAMLDKIINFTSQEEGEAGVRTAPRASGKHF
ncbi:Glutamate receptor 1 [Frankliniella fusca]|uniref:Glutamate receptor 1 n=1 Tax=Frankliniella fusca TaxID=407009 RepID=A0AAE1HFT3_9NEOP|nr:Glutamate receptor 1 [Frankliniella fusca]